MNLNYDTDPLWYSLSIIGALLYVAYITNGFKKDELSNNKISFYFMVLMLSSVCMAIGLTSIENIGKKFFPAKDFSHFLTPDYFKGDYTVRYKFSENSKVYYGITSLEYTRMQSEYDNPCSIIFNEINTQNGKIIKLDRDGDNCFYDIEKWFKGEIENDKPIYIYITRDKIK